MNFSSVVGFLIAAAVLIFAVEDAGEGARVVLLNLHAFLIVIGGTIAASCVCFPVFRMIRLVFVALKKLVGLSAVNYEGVIQEVISFANGAQKDPAYLKTALVQAKHPFFKEGLQLLIDGVGGEQFQKIMEARIETIKRRYMIEVNMFRTISKFPPAFGLLGTTFGMIGLLNKLGGADAQKMVGPAMAVGLVATLYGIGLANFIFIPIAENLAAMGIEDNAARKMILDGLLLIKQKTHPLIVEERMTSYLLPGERAAIKKRAA